MPRKRKMLEIEDLLDEQPDPTSNDMIFITATDESEPTKKEVEHMSRLERIKSTAVEIDEPGFEGEIDLDMGTISLNKEEDARRIKKELLKQEKITKASNKQRDDIVEKMTGSEPEDIVEQFDSDVPIQVKDKVDRNEIKKVNRAAVNEILADLTKR